MLISVPVFHFAERSQYSAELLSSLSFLTGGGWCGKDQSLVTFRGSQCGV